MRKSALVVDHCRMSRRLLRHVLTVAGYDVTEADDAAEALALLDIPDRPAVDLVVSDYTMPGMNGVALIRRLRERPEFRAVVMLIVSSEHAEDKKREGLDAGATAWLPKPVQVRRMLRYIGRNNT
jgi:two-component system, chemotaxis family, chemotaxis protein CheY